MRKDLSEFNVGGNRKVRYGKIAQEFANAVRGGETDKMLVVRFSSPNEKEEAEKYQAKSKAWYQIYQKNGGYNDFLAGSYFGILGHEGIVTTAEIGEEGVYLVAEYDMLARYKREEDQEKQVSFLVQKVNDKTFYKTGMKRLASLNPKVYKRVIEELEKEGS